MNILENAKNHFKEKLTQPLGCVEVPEWGEGATPAKIYYKPLNMLQKDKIYKFLNDGSLKFIVQTLIERALDEDGKKLWRDVNMSEFMRHVDPDIASSVVAQMAEDDTTVEEATKN